MLGVNFDKRHFDFFFTFTLDLMFHVKCPNRRYFTWNVKSFFWGRGGGGEVENREIPSVCRPLNMPIACEVLISLEIIRAYMSQITAYLIKF